eukprot:6201763-Pleurochrysis_carterae.AAC.1
MADKQQDADAMIADTAAAAAAAKVKVKAKAEAEAEAAFAKKLAQAEEKAKEEAAAKEAAKEAAKAKAAALKAAEEQKAALDGVSLGPVSFQRSNFFKVNEQLIKELPGGRPTMVQVWEAVVRIACYYSGDDEGNEFVRRLRKSVNKFCEDHDVDTDDVKSVAEMLWCSSEKADGVELCSLLNRCLREDSVIGGDGKPLLRSAVVLTRAINTNLVDPQLAGVVRGEGRPGVDTSKDFLRSWPDGPSATTGAWSSNRDTTWRGTQMPKSDLQFYLDLKQSKCKKFRTKMFTATSFSRPVAEAFATRISGEDNEVALIRFNFCRDCKHVNFLKHTCYPEEKEFLLPPYTALELVDVKGSNDSTSLTKIIVNVMSCNQTELGEERKTADYKLASRI